MKKIFIILNIILILTLTGCSLGNNPTSKVEDLLSKYQMLDQDIKDEIEIVVTSEDLTEEQQNRYRKLLEKQYRNLTYEIKDEEEDGNKATITTQIEVLDYKKAITMTNSIYDNITNYSNEDYNDTKLDNLEAMKETVVYTIDFTLTKDIDGNWNLDSLDNDIIKKMQGMY